MDEEDHIGTLTPFAVVKHMAKATPAQRCVLIDCRSFLSFNVAHVRSALNIHCPPILKRRLHRGSVASDSLLTNTEARERVQEADSLIFYDERTMNWSELESDSTMRIVCKLLRRERKRKHIYYIKGELGFPAYVYLSWSFAPLFFSLSTCLAWDLILVWYFSYFASGL